MFFPDYRAIDCDSMYILYIAKKSFFDKFSKRDWLIVNRFSTKIVILAVICFESVIFGMNMPAQVN